MGEEEKTIPATPRRRQEARKKGNVPRSADINSAFILIVAALLFLAIGKKLVTGLIVIFNYFLGESWSIEVSSENLSSILLFSANHLSKFIIPFFITITVVGIASTFILGGFVFAPKALSLKLQSLNPIQGVKRMFSANSFFTLGKSLLKLALAGGVTYMVIRASLVRFLPIVAMSAESQIKFIAKEAFNLTLAISMVFIVVAAIDYFFQRWQYEKSIRMTPKEVKEELKQYEGSPEMKSRIRAKQRELARRRMMEEVPKATVVITNPIRLAIALKYEPKVNKSPLVVAKGGGAVAKKIKEIARKYGVPIVENKELARLLFRLSKIGEEIPVKLYQTVAEVIAYVYKLKQKIAN